MGDIDFNWELFTQQTAEILETVRSQGFETPLYLTAVGVNGNMLFVRYTQSTSGEGLDSEVLASNTTNKIFSLPINIMITDAVGKAARVCIEVSQKPRFFFN